MRRRDFLKLCAAAIAVPAALVRTAPPDDVDAIGGLVACELEPDAYVLYPCLTPLRNPICPTPWTAAQIAELQRQWDAIVEHSTPLEDLL